MNTRVAKKLKPLANYSNSPLVKMLEDIHGELKFYKDKGKTIRYFEHYPFSSLERLTKKLWSNTPHRKRQKLFRLISEV